MAKMTIKGLDEYALKISKFGDSSDEVAGKAIYESAGIVAEEIRANLETAFAVDDTYNLHAYKEGRPYRLSETQKKGLVEGFGITKMQNDNGFFNVKIGFDGYNDIKTKKYPNGQPNQLIARVVESGSTLMKKQPIIRPAVNATRKLAKLKMQEVIDKKIEEIGL